MNNALVNTIPHSGTHLVTTILNSFGYNQSVIRNRFYSVKPYFRRTQLAGINWRSAKDLSNITSLNQKKTILVSVASPRLARPKVLESLFSKIAEREYIIGHIPYSDESNELIDRYITKTITIIRDPRDMALSMINHVKTRPQHHAHKYFFGQLTTDSERLEAILFGYENKFGHMSSVASMYNSMLQWQKQPHNLTMKFEDLVGPRGGGETKNQVSCIKSLSTHLELSENFDDASILNIAKNSFGTSGTFRKGKIGGWSDVFTFEDKQLFSSALSDLLVELGYETSNAWY